MCPWWPNRLCQVAATGFADEPDARPAVLLSVQSFYQAGRGVDSEHLEVLASVSWDSPEEQPEKVAPVVAKIANRTGMRLKALPLECEQILSGTDVRHLAQAATAKLKEIDKQLATLKGYSGPRKLDHKLSYCGGPGKG